MCNENLLFNSDLWSLISAIAAAISTIVALVTIRQVFKYQKIERESKRPYFIIEKPGIKKIEQSSFFRIIIGIENKGTHVADNFEGKILILKSDLSSKPDTDISFSVANPIPKNNPTPWYYDELTLLDNIPKQYIVLAIKYKDIILDKKYNQTYFMKWDGVTKGMTYPDFTHTSTEEADKLKEYLKVDLNKFFSNKI